MHEVSIESRMRAEFALPARRRPVAPLPVGSTTVGDGRVTPLRRRSDDVADIATGTGEDSLITHVAPDLRVRRRSDLVNRAVNVAVAATALLAVSPIMLLVAAAVKLTSRGPVFYTQVRVGLDRRSRRSRAVYDRRSQNLGGKTFTIYKFRSMTVDAEQGSGAVWATKSDPRVTPLGRFIRATRLDELPQLVNVIKGDMNIVGPRPERPSIFANLRQSISDYPLRQRARPGITGLAQINHSYDACIDDVRVKVGYDLEYLRTQGVMADFKIMARTIPVMLFRKTGW